MQCSPVEPVVSTSTLSRRKERLLATSSRTLSSYVSSSVPVKSKDIRESPVSSSPTTSTVGARQSKSPAFRALQPRLRSEFVSHSHQRFEPSSHVYSWSSSATSTVRAPPASSTVRAPQIRLQLEFFSHQQLSSSITSSAELFSQHRLHGSSTSSGRPPSPLTELSPSLHQRVGTLFLIVFQ